MARQRKRTKSLIRIEPLEERRLLSISAATPGVEIDTNMGDIFVQLFPNTAPQTVANFLSYVDNGRYNNAVINRINKIFTFKGSSSDSLTFATNDLFHGNSSTALTFVNPGDNLNPPTLSRSTGSFITDGFVVNQAITISGTPSNNISVHIAAVTASTLTFATSDPIVTEGIANSTAVDIKASDTITRSSGSFLTEGFAAGQGVLISGTTSNDRIVGIDSISSDGKTIRLADAPGTVTPQTISDSTNVSMVSGPGIIQGGGFTVGTNNLGNQALLPISQGVFVGDASTSLTFAPNGDFSGATTTALFLASNGDFHGGATTPLTFASNGDFRGDSSTALTFNPTGDFHGNGSTGLTFGANGDFFGNASTTLTLAVNGNFHGATGTSLTFAPNGDFRGAAGTSLTFAANGDFRGAAGTSLTFSANGDFRGSAGTSLTFASNGDFRGDAATTLTFASDGINPDTITRSGGSFLTEGFAPGQTLTITGTTSNNKTVTVASVTATVITLTQIATLAPEVIADSTNAHITAGLADTITRSTGSFVTDGFAAGQTITITGTGSNNITATIGSVSATVITLTATNGVLATETVANSTAVGITAGLADTITRSTGSFITDGFLAGQTITITGTASNNVTATIASVSATVITLTATNGVLAAETIADSTPVGISAGLADTITRSTGSFVTDGFVAGQTLTITGTTSNNVTVTIASVTPTVITLTATNGVLAAETIADSTNAHITAGLPDTITRSTGSFITDGFAAGQSITITGTTANNVTATIATVTATVITLTATNGVLAPETVADSTNAHIISNAADTITRSAGSFVDEGFAVGQAITLTGTTSNNVTLHIASVTPTALTLSEPNGTLIPEVIANTTNTHISAGLAGTITRTIGSFIDDGFAAGQTIVLTGSASNNFTFHVASVTATVLTLTETTTIVPEILGNASSVLITAGLPDTITRTGGTGSFITEGFAVGQQISITGTIEDNVTATIGTVTANTITLTQTDTLFFQSIPDSTPIHISAGLNDTITRTVGSFVADGFAIGQTITISGTTSNNTTGQIAAVTPTVITLTATNGVLAPETIADTTAVGITSNVADTITRSDGSFITDGFAVGQTITLSGTTSNNKTFHIGSLTDTVITLSDATGALLPENFTDSSTVGITAGIPDTITRSGGSFITEHFAVGQALTISGTTNNNVTVHIASLTPTVITLVETSGALKAETIPESTNVSIGGVATIPDESTAIPNTRGTIAMAKTSSPNSATNQFFINTGDNSQLLSPANQTNGGFTVFGQVIYGLSVADKINGLFPADLSSTLGGSASSIPITTHNQFVSISTAREASLITLVIGSGQTASSVKFPNADGSTGTVSITKGTATLDFTGQNLAATESNGVITLTGTVLTFLDVSTSKTSLATNLKVSATQHGIVPLVDLNTPTALGSLNGSGLALQGSYTTAGTLTWSSTHGSLTDPKAKGILATVSLSGAKTITYQFDQQVQIMQSGGSSRAKGIVSPDNVKGQINIFNMAATGTTKASHLQVTAGPGQFVNMQGFSTDGSIGTISGVKMNIVGPFTIAGTLGRADLLGINGGTMSIGGVGAKKGQSAFILTNTNSNASLFSNMPLSALLIRNGWTSETTTGTIEAPSIGRLECLSTFAANVHLTDPAGKTSLVKMIRLGQSQWLLAGSVTKFHAGSIDAAFKAEIDGSVGLIQTGDITSENRTLNNVDRHTSITVKGDVGTIQTGNMINGIAPTDPGQKFLDSGFQGEVDGKVGSINGGLFSGNWTVKSVNTIHFKGFNNGFLTSTAPFQAGKLAIGSIQIDGVADKLGVTSTGNVGSISASRISDRSRIQIGLTLNQTTANTLPPTSAPYTSHASLGSLNVGSFSNTLVEAWHLGQLNLGPINTSNVGIPFGLGAHLIDAVHATNLTGQSLGIFNAVGPKTSAVGDYQVILI